MKCGRKRRVVAHEGGRKRWVLLYTDFAQAKGSFTIVNIYVLVQRVLGGGGSEASVLFLKW